MDLFPLSFLFEWNRSIAPLSPPLPCVAFFLTQTRSHPHLSSRSELASQLSSSALLHLVSLCLIHSQLSSRVSLPSLLHSRVSIAAPSVQLCRVQLIFCLNLTKSRAEKLTIYLNLLVESSAGVRFSYAYTSSDIKDSGDKEQVYHLMLPHLPISTSQPKLLIYVLPY